MKLKKVFLMIVAILAIIAVSCSEGNYNEALDLTVQSSEPTIQDNPNIVTIEELSQIITTPNRLPISRSSNQGYQVSVLSGNNSPIIYVINFDEGGWVLLSAAKTYEPVLAYSDEGVFNPSGIEMVQGVFNWVKDIEADIEHSLQLPEDSVKNIRSYWDLLLSHPLTNPFAESRATIEENIAQARQVVADSLSSWQRKGYTVRAITELDLYDTENENLDALENIKNNTYWALMEDYERYSYIVEYTESRPGSKSKELNLSTNWNQTYPFNSFFPNNYYTGCTTIAAAQIMFFHKWPTTYDWANIYSKSYSDDLGKMLYDVAERIGVEYEPTGTSANIDEVKDMFKRNGYSANVMDFNDNSVKVSLGNNFPVYARGKNSDGNGHAWVLSGYSFYAGSDRYYKVYYLPYPSSMSSLYEKATNLGAGSTRYRCNWGWGGAYDGYYSNNFNPRSDTFNRDNKILIVTPNK